MILSRKCKTFLEICGVNWALILNLVLQRLVQRLRYSSIQLSKISNLLQLRSYPCPTSYVSKSAARTECQECTWSFHQAGNGGAHNNFPFAGICSQSLVVTVFCIDFHEQNEGVGNVLKTVEDCHAERLPRPAAIFMYGLHGFNLFLCYGAGQKVLF